MDNLPKRKSLRLKDYDYRKSGAYFVTICTQDRKRILSDIISLPGYVDTNEVMTMVGEGLDPPASTHQTTGAAGAASYSPTGFSDQVLPTCYPKIKLKPAGEIAVSQLLDLEIRFKTVEIVEYVIMPDHIHAIIVLGENESITNTSLLDVMRVYKSLTSRLCKQMLGIDKLFQRSYVEHIIRDKEDYSTRQRYIFDNPIKWCYENNLAE